MLVKDIKFLSGIYKIDFPNGKSYIGLSNNFKVRFKDHNTAVKISQLPLYQAVRKYLNGKITEFTLLEEIDPNDRKLLQERERYWIQYYKTMEPEYGYNLTLGGDGASPGIYNHEAKLDAEQIQNLYQDLQYNLDMFIYQLAEKYGLSCEAVSEINRGNRYFNPNLSYPLRKAPPPPKRYGLENHLTKFTQEDLDRIYNLLINTTMTFNDIAIQEGICYGTVSNINTGKRYAQDGYTYPLRQKQKNLCLTEQQAADIKKLLAETNLSQSAIAKQFKVSADTIYRINSGKNYYSNNYNYPIRAKKDNRN